MYLYKLTHKISVFEQYWDKQKKFMLMEKTFQSFERKLCLTLTALFIWDPSISHVFQPFTRSFLILAATHSSPVVREILKALLFP